MMYFIKVDDFTILNVNEIAYTDTSIDEDANYILNVVMKDGKHFIFEGEQRDRIWKKILEWTGAEEDED